MPADLDPTKVRQGRRGRQVLVILGASLLLALLVIGGLTLYRTMTAPERAGGPAPPVERPAANEPVERPAADEPINPTFPE